MILFPTVIFCYNVGSSILFMDLMDERIDQETLTCFVSQIDLQPPVIILLKRPPQPLDDFSIHRAAQNISRRFDAIAHAFWQAQHKFICGVGRELFATHPQLDSSDLTQKSMIAT